MTSDSSALSRAVFVTRVDDATARAVPDPGWDVRVMGVVSDAEAEVILGRLLVPMGAEVLKQPPVTRVGSAVSLPWLGSLRVIRIPVQMRQGRMLADGVVEVMRVGSGATEVSLSLRSKKRAARLSGWRRLNRAAAAAADHLFHDRECVEAA